MVTGSVTSGRTPLAGAHVRVDAVTPKIDRTTGADGRYSFVIPSSNVRGQAVRITVTMQDRRARYASKSANITLAGGAVTQDFDLERTSGDEPDRSGQPDTAAQSSGGRRAIIAPAEEAPFEDLSGAVDLGSALAGRFVGCECRRHRPAVRLTSHCEALARFSARVSRSSSSMAFAFDNTVFASPAQRFGLGGFDYGSPLADLDLASIASIRILSPGEAAAGYGGRGANGVVIVTTNPALARRHSRFRRRNSSRATPICGSPTYQNQFGQGLNGKFQFFDGRGGGVNDAVDENWGPALNGQPIAQASYTEPGRADVAFGCRSRTTFATISRMAAP